MTKFSGEPGGLGISVIVCTFVALLFADGCKPPDVGPNGVVAVFGDVGLAPGAFSYPRAIASDPNGSILVVDKSARVQRFAPDGTVLGVWSMPDKEKGKPVGLTVHPDGRVFVADTHYSRVLVFSAEGEILNSFGREGVGDGEFQLPTDIAFDADGFIYVSEYHGNDRISKWSPDFQFVTAFGTEPLDGLPLSRPAGIDIDAEQTIWVADACNHRIVRFSRDGKFLGSFGGFGQSSGQLKYPYDVSVTPDGELLVCEYGGNRLQWFNLSGESLRVWGTSGRQLGQLSSPWGATCQQDGLVYIVDSLNSRIQVVRPI